MGHDEILGKSEEIMTKSKICLREEQVDRLMNDTAKLARGIDDDSICPTVREMYIDTVGSPTKKGKNVKKEKDPIEIVERLAINKLKKKIEGFF